MKLSRSLCNLLFATLVLSLATVATAQVKAKVKTAAKPVAHAKSSGSVGEKLASLQRAIDDLATTYPDRFDGKKYKTQWQKFVDRWHEVRQDVYNLDNLMARVDSHADPIQE